MGAAAKRPEKVIGMHFFNPAHVMKLVEVIPGLETDQDTIDSVVTFAESLRKIPVVVQECPGFLVNRLLMPYLNEATYCLQEGAATATEIDEAIVGFGMPMGPFTLMDMLGLDIGYDVGKHLYSEYGERMKPAALFERLYGAGRFGEKVGAGFYGYGDQTDETGIKGTPFSVERCFLPLINEAAMCLQENIASPTDIDMAMIAGTGMKKGDTPMGLLAIGDEMGLDKVLAQLEEFEAQFGERFRPARLLRLKVKANHLGVKTRLLRLKVKANHLGVKTGKGFLEHAG